MLAFWQFTYSYLLIPLFWLVIRCLGLVNDKVRRGIRGRKHLFATLEAKVGSLKPGKRLWIHSSSLGEFEQAKPIIAEVKKRFPDLRIIVTFFSPSGFEHSRRYPLADLISYLPFDSRAGARRFLAIVQPDAAVMVRYDIWPNHIWETHRLGIPLMIANATMRRQTARRIPLIRSFHQHVYNAIDEILTVSETDRQAFWFYRLTHPQIVVVGDSRYDQVVTRSFEAQQRHLIPDTVLAGKQVIVVGSSWPEDEEVILPVFYKLQETLPDLLMILVPHEPTVHRIEELEDTLTGNSSSIRFSGLNDYANQRVLIVDSIGVLVALYKYAHVAYVGGSFRQGVHNVLEAAVYGVPVVFGPRHRNSQEPLMLVEKGGAFVVNNSPELYRTMRNLLEDERARRRAGDRAAAFVQSHIGATEGLLKHFDPFLKTSSTETGKSS